MKQEQIKKNILQVMACGGEVKILVVNKVSRYDGEKLLISFDEPPIHIDNKVGLQNVIDNLERAKPIFHRLSSLTKEITVEGYNDCEAFVPIDKLRLLYGLKHYTINVNYDDNLLFYRINSINSVWINDVNSVTDQLHAWGFFTGDQELFDSGDIIDKLKI